MGRAQAGPSSQKLGTIKGLYRVSGLRGEDLGFRIKGDMGFPKT